MTLPNPQIGHPTCFQTGSVQETSAVSVDTAYFMGHQLQATQAARRIEMALQGECSICLDNFTESDTKKLSMLSCSHIFHSEPCLSNALKEQPVCPVCRASADDSTIKVYKNSAALKATLPLECRSSLCTVIGDKTTLSSGTMDQCPYPLAMFPHQKAESFLEQNSSAIIDWLRESFAQKHYSVSQLHYDEKYCGSGLSHLHEKPAITMEIRFAPDQPKKGFYYASLDINKAETPEAAFKNLLEDLRTDLLVLHLRKAYPAMFDHRTELFIHHYDLWNRNVFYINGMSTTIPLRAVFDPATKSFSWDQLKQELDKQGLEYSKLFDETLLMRSAEYAWRSTDIQVDGLDEVDTDGGSLLHGYPVEQDEIDRAEIPSGELATDEFLF